MSSGSGTRSRTMKVASPLSSAKNTCTNRVVIIRTDKATIMTLSFSNAMRQFEINKIQLH